MSSAYTTEELVQILATEQRACVNGQRLNLQATITGINPVIDRFLNTEGLQKFTAYAEFRATIHRYQLDHDVSGLVWRKLTVHNQPLTYPTIHDQLIALPTDLEVIRQAKAQVLAFWQHVTAGMDLYLAVNCGRDHRLLTAPEISGIVDRTDWAAMTSHGTGSKLMIILQLGWGSPNEAMDRRNFPAAGSEQICAVYPNQRPISY